MWKMSSEEFFFPDLTCHFFLFLYLCHLPATCNSWVLFLKQKVVHCVLSFWLVCVMLRSYMLMLFQYLWISSQIEPDVICVITARKHLVQTKNIRKHLLSSGSSRSETLLWQKQLIPAPFYLKSISVLLI